jgi:hypothetical protein
VVTQGDKGLAKTKLFLAILAIVSTTGIASADWLVTRDGELIATEGAWRIEGRNVVFIAGSPNAANEISRQGTSLPIRTMSVGTLFLLPVSEIDLPRSEAETARRSVQQPADTNSRVDPVARKAYRNSAPTIRDTAPPGRFFEAREDWEESRFSPAPIELQVSLRGSSSSNYFRTPDELPQTEVNTATTAARLTWKWTKKKPLKSYLELGQTQYDEFPSTSSYGAGFRYEGRRNSFDISTRFSRNRRALDIGETFEAADMAGSGGSSASSSTRSSMRPAGMMVRSMSVGPAFFTGDSAVSSPRRSVPHGLNEVP